ncbi:MAG TPA: DUF6015 family protein [Candidatus Thermoplasmatota archaeon]|nr:DUF6015 family protein [Candidatus Thermoplasmatota archaeon]
MHGLKNAEDTRLEDDEEMIEVDVEDDAEVAARALTLATALKDRFDMADEDASAVAEIVARAFHGHEEVNDETLDPELRSLFYTLEAKRLLAFRREEYTWENGERRRAFWWRVRDEELEKMEEMRSVAVEDSVYDQLPSSVWARQAS